MPLLLHSLSSQHFQNLSMQSPALDTVSSASPFSPLIHVILSFLTVCVLHVTTRHAPLPESFSVSLRHIIEMLLSPVSGTIASTISICNIFAALTTKRRNRSGAARQLADAISAGAIVIQIPRRFLSMLNEHCSWRPLSHQISDQQIFWQTDQRNGANAPPRNTHYGITSTARDVFSEEPMLYSLPPTSRITCNTLVQVFRSSNKIVIAVTLLQLIYTAFKVYIQYGMLIRDRGLSTPFLVAIPYLYMSFVNLIANLVQGSYTHVTTIEPRLALSVGTPTVPDPHVIPMADHAVGEGHPTEG